MIVGFLLVTTLSHQRHNFASTHIGNYNRKMEEICPTVYARIVGSWIWKQSQGMEAGLD